MENKIRLRAVVIAIGLLIIQLILANCLSITIAPGFSGKSLTCAIPSVLGNGFESLLKGFQDGFQIDVKEQYGDSVTLLSQLNASNPCDVMIVEQSAVRNNEQLKPLLYGEKERLFELIFEMPVMLIKKLNPKVISGFNDLLRPDVRIGITNPATTIMGRQASDILNHLPELKSSEGSGKVHVIESNQMVLSIVNGETDVLLGYRFLHFLYPDQLDMIPLPQETYPGMVVFCGFVTAFTSDYREAHALVSWLCNLPAKDVLRDKGFMPTRNYFLQKSGADDKEYYPGDGAPH